VFVGDTHFGTPVTPPPFLIDADVDVSDRSFQTRNLSQIPPFFSDQRSVIDTPLNGLSALNHLITGAYYVFSACPQFFSLVDEP